MTCVYQGHYREICPHIIGRTRRQGTAARFAVRRQHQLRRCRAGGAWKCLDIAAMTRRRRRATADGTPAPVARDGADLRAARSISISTSMSASAERMSTAAHRHRRLVDPEAARGGVSGGGQPSRTLRAALQRGRDQLVVLSPAPARDLRTLGRDGAGRFRIRREGAARDHARRAPCRRGGRARPVSRRGDRPRRQARAAAVPACRRASRSTRARRARS